jgi:hypothetical protein
MNQSQEARTEAGLISVFCEEAELQDSRAVVVNTQKGWFRPAVISLDRKTVIKWLGRPCFRYERPRLKAIGYAFPSGA